MKLRTLPATRPKILTAAIALGVLFLTNTFLHAGFPGYYFNELLFNFGGDDSVLVNSRAYDGHDAGNQQRPYGMVEDPEGKRWVGFYEGFSNEFVRVPGDTLRLTGIRCFLPDGTEADFSPLEFFSFEDGTRDTLYRSSAYNGNCRGISLTEGGNILYTARSTLMLIDYRDGSGIARWHPGLDGKPVRTFVKAAHDPLSGHIYLGTYPQQEPVYIFDEDLQLLDTAVARVPTLQNAMIARTAPGGLTQLFSATHAPGRGIFVYESAAPRSEGFHLADTIGNYSETTDSNTIFYIAWPSALDWLDRDEGVIIFGNDYRALTEVNSGTAPPSPHAGRWYIWDVDNDSMIAAFGAPWYETDGGDPRPKAVDEDVPQMFLCNRPMCMRPSGAYYRFPEEESGLVITDMELGCVQALVWSETAVAGGRFVPLDLRLDQNYPNPFNPVTQISFQLPRKASVSLIVHDISGKKLREIFQGHLEAGRHNIRFNAGALPSGMYFYTLQTEKLSVTRKMSLLK